MLDFALNRQFDPLNKESQIDRFHFTQAAHTKTEHTGR